MGLSDFIWSPNKGFFQNTFHAIEIGASMFGSIPSRLVVFFTSSLGVGLEELGKEIDELLGTSSSKMPDMDADTIATKVTNEIFGTSDAKISESLLYFNDVRIAKVATIHKKAGAFAAIKAIGLKSGKGFIGAFYQKLKLIISLVLKVAGAYFGYQALKISDEGNDVASKSVDGDFGNAPLARSTKEKAQRYRNNLEKHISNIMGE